MPDGLGGHEQVWTEVASVFAMIEPVSAQAVFGAGQMLETVTHRITMRWRDGVASGMRLTKAGTDLRRSLPSTIPTRPAAISSAGQGRCGA